MRFCRGAGYGGGTRCDDDDIPRLGWIRCDTWLDWCGFEAEKILPKGSVDDDIIIGAAAGVE